MTVAATPASGFGSALGAQIGAEIKNRWRSPASLVAFLVILIGSYWAIPPADGRAVSLSWELPDGRLQSPLYTAGYLGIAVSILTLLFFMMAAFYLVAGSVKRDRERGIGAILAATPMTKSSYLGAKFAAHTLYLILLSLLVFPVGFFHFFSSGEGAFDPVAFFLPHLLMALPAAVFIAGAALLFDVTPVLRSRGGLVLWFLFGVMPLMAVPMTMAQDPANRHRIGEVPIFDPLGMATQARMTQDSLPATITNGVSIGYVFHDRMPERVRWAGLRFTPSLLRDRAVNLLWGLLPLGLAVLMFDRFDPARRGGARRQRQPSAATVAAPAPGPDAVASAGRRREAPARTLASLTPVEPRASATQAILAEVRLLWESANVAKWLLVPAVLAAALIPGEGAKIAGAAFLLLLVPLISEVACREELAGARSLVFSQPAVPRSVVLWKTAAVALFLLAASLPLTLRGLATNPAQAIAVPLGMLFVAGFAVGAGSLTGGGKLFSGVYLLLWYLALNGLGEADFCGLLAPPAGWRTRAGFLAAGALWVAVAGVAERYRRR